MSHSDDPTNGHSRNFPAGKISDDEVDDIIGIASDIAEEDRQRQAQLDVGDVVQIGEELGLDGHHVEQAVDELRDRQQRDAEDNARRRKQIKKYLTVTAVAVGVVFALLLLMGLMGRSSLRELSAEVDKKRAQLQNVVERQQKVDARYANMPSTPEHDAEIDGALNRVSIERRRYDEAATRYNTEAGSLTGSLAATFFGMPETVPPSAEVIKNLSQ